MNLKTTWQHVAAFVHEFAHRVKQETPSFFRRVRAFGYWLAGVGASFSSSELLHVKLPAMLTELGGHILGIGLVMAVVATAACKQTPDLPGSNS